MGNWRRVLTANEVGTTVNGQIGTDTDISCSSTECVSAITVTDGVISSMSKQTIPGAAGEANQTLTTGTGISGANSGSSGDFTMAIGQAVGTSDNVSFGNVTASGTVKGTYFSHPTTNSNTVIRGNNTGIDVDIQDSSGNSIAFFEASNKYVGINQTNPLAFLHIDCGAVYDRGLRIEHDGVTNIDIFTDGASRAHFKHNQNNIAMENSGYTAFTCANAERMRIDSSGQLGIATTAPEDMLHVIDGTNGEHMFGQYYTHNRTEPAMVSIGRQGGTIASPAIIASTGAGSGTKLGEYGFRAYSTGGGGPVWHNAANISCVTDQNFDTNQAPGALVFNTLQSYSANGNTPAERMRVSSTGNVSIGTTANTYKLDVNGTLNAGAITCTTLNTGQGANELYSMDQNVRQDSNVEFADGTFTGDLLCESGLQADANIVCASGDIITIGDFDSGNGSGAAPSHTFTNDKDTGMYRVGVDQLGFATGGAKRLSISSSTMEVTNDLVVKAGSGASDVTVQAPSSGNANLFLLSNNAANNQDKFKIQVDPTGYLKFYYNTGSYVEGASLKSNGAFSFANSTQFTNGFSVTGGTAYVGGTSIRNGSIINAGTVGTGYLGSGTANSSTFLRGDGTWASPGGGGNIYWSIMCDFRANSTEKFLPLSGNGSGTTATTFSGKMGTGCYWVAPVAGNLDSCRVMLEDSYGSSCSIKVYVNDSLQRSITQSLTQSGVSNDYNVTLDVDCSAGDSLTIAVDPSTSSPDASSWQFKFVPS